MAAEETQRSIYEDLQTARDDLSQAIESRKARYFTLKSKLRTLQNAIIRYNDLPEREQNTPSLISSSKELERSTSRTLEWVNILGCLA